MSVSYSNHVRMMDNVSMLSTEYAVSVYQDGQVNKYQTITSENGFYSLLLIFLNQPILDLYINLNFNSEFVTKILNSRVHY